LSSICCLLLFPLPLIWRFAPQIHCRPSGPHDVVAAPGRLQAQVRRRCLRRRILLLLGLDGFFPPSITVGLCAS
jgi:hypothetical protein